MWISSAVVPLYSLTKGFKFNLLDFFLSKNSSLKNASSDTDSSYIIDIVDDVPQDGVIFRDIPFPWLIVTIIESLTKKTQMKQAQHRAAADRYRHKSHGVIQY